MRIAAHNTYNFGIIIRKMYDKREGVLFCYDVFPFVIMIVYAVCIIHSQQQSRSEDRLSIAFDVARTSSIFTQQACRSLRILRACRNVPLQLPRSPRRASLLFLGSLWSVCCILPRSSGTPDIRLQVPCCRE